VRRAISHPLAGLENFSLLCYSCGGGGRKDVENHFTNIRDNFSNVEGSVL